MPKKAHIKATDVARSIWRLEGRCESNDVPNSVWVCRSVVVGNTSPQLQGAHIYGVGAYPRLKVDLRNGMSLCANCHRHFTSSPLEFAEFVKNTKYAEYLDDLIALNNGPRVKIFWEDKLAELRKIHKEISSGRMTLEEARRAEYVH